MVWRIIRILRIPGWITDREYNQEHGRSDPACPEIPWMYQEVYAPAAAEPGNCEL